MNIITKENKKITPVIKAFIVETIKDVLEDPDFGLELSTKSKNRIKEIPTLLKKKVSLADIKKKYY